MEGLAWEVVHVTASRMSDDQIDPIESRRQIRW